MNLNQLASDKATTPSADELAEELPPNNGSTAGEDLAPQVQETAGVPALAVAAHSVSSGVSPKVDGPSLASRRTPASRRPLKVWWKELVIYGSATVVTAAIVGVLLLSGKRPPVESTSDSPAAGEERSTEPLASIDPSDDDFSTPSTEPNLEAAAPDVRPLAAAAAEGKATSRGGQSDKLALGDHLVARYTFEKDGQAGNQMHPLKATEDPEFAVGPEGARALVCGEARLTVRDHADLDIGPGDFAISLWFLRRPDPRDNLRLLSKHDGKWVGYCIRGGDRNIFFDMGNGTARPYVSAATRGPGVWQHLAVNVDREVGTATLFLDGKAKATQSIRDLGDANIDSGAPLTIGAMASGPGGRLRWKGAVDDVRIYRRTLTEQEVQAEYRADLATGLAAPVSAKGATLHEVAKKAERPAGAPEYADVCFRYGWIRSEGPASVENARKAVRAFHATRIDWFYSGTHTAQDGAVHVSPEAKDFIDWCHANDMKIGGAINNNTKNPDWMYKKHHLDRYVGEPSNPDFIAHVLAWGKAQIDAGVDTMVCDDIFQYDAPRQQIWSDKVLAKLKAYKPGFTIAGNNGHSISTDYVKRYAVDFHYSDSNFVPKPGAWWSASKAHRALKSAFLIQPNRHMAIGTRRQLIALGYGSGAHVIAPWDSYIHGKERLFSEPGDFADLYGFARALGQMGYLDGYEDAAVAGYDLKETRYGVRPPMVLSPAGTKVSVFARAMPGAADRPVVIHLIHMGSPTAFKLNLRKSNFFGERNVQCSLLNRVPYSSEAHEKASQSSDYGKLVKAVDLKPEAKGDFITLPIPPVHPWGVVIVSPAGPDRK